MKTLSTLLLAALLAAGTAAAQPLAERTDAELLGERERAVRELAEHREREHWNGVLTALLFVTGASAASGGSGLSSPGVVGASMSSGAFEGVMEARVAAERARLRIAEIDRQLSARGIAVPGSNVARDAATRAAAPAVPAASAANGAGMPR